MNTPKVLTRGLASRPTQAALVRSHITTGAVVVVAAVAAIVSYAHMQTVADRAGEGWRAHLLPLSVDGLVVAASMVLVTRRHAGLPGGWLAWGALCSGVVTSVAANIAAAQPNATARLVAAWPAVAFAVAFELLLQQRHADRAAPRPRPVRALFRSLWPDRGRTRHRRTTPRSTIPVADRGVSPPYYRVGTV